MELKRIRHALALAQELNFVRAAEKVHLSQPAFSRSIQALESELGMCLFERSKQGLSITAAGTQFLARARRLSDEAFNLERDMALTRSGEIGQVSFGAGPLPAASLLPALLQRVRQGRPAFRVALQVNNSQQLLSKLLDDAIEFFIADTQNIALDNDISITALTRQQGPFACRAGHPLLSLPSLQLEDIRPYGFASMSIPRSTVTAFHKALGLGADQDLPIMFECDDISLLKQVVCQEDLILIISHAAVASEIATGLLCPLQVEDMPPLFAEVGVVQRRGRTLSPSAQLVLDSLREMVAATGPIA